MKNLIDQKAITPQELCGRMAKYKSGIDKDTVGILDGLRAELKKTGIPDGRSATDEVLENFSELLRRTIQKDQTTKETIRTVVDDLIKSKISISFAETFVFGFKDILIPYLQKEFSDQYYGFFSAEKIIDAALRQIWMTAIDEYYRQTMEAVEKNEKRYRTIFESSRDAVMTLAPPFWKFTSGNTATVRMFRTKDEKAFISLGPWEVSPKYQPDGQLSAAKAKKMIMKAMKDGSNFFEWTHKRLGGEDFPATVLLTRVKLGGRTFLQATVRDVTRQKQIEEKLVEKEQMLENITQGIGEGIMLLSTDLRIIWANRTVYKQTGLSQKDVIGNYCYRITHHRSTPCRPPKDPCPVQDLMKTKTPVRMVHTHTNKDGKKLSVEVTAYPVRDERGRIVNFVHITRDITDRKKAEEMLKESEEKFRSIFENAGDGILVADTEKRRFLMANKKMCRMLGYTEKELLKLDVSRIHPKKDLPKVVRAFKLQAQKKLTVAKSLPVLRKNGTVFYADISSGPFVLKGKRYMMGFFRPVGGT